MGQKVDASVVATVSQIIEKVEKQGDRALEYYTKKLDKVSLTASNFLVKSQKIREAFHKISQPVKSALLLAKSRIEAFHSEELKHIRKNWSLNLDGIRVGQFGYPLDIIGIYVPGGRYCYPSTVLMTALPARIAGVKQIVMVTPPQNLREEILAAAFVCGVDQCFSVGGPAAIAALALGTKTIPKVQKIVGPWNQYVTEAKRQLFGQVGIDGLAGPSEIAVWADASANVSKIVLNLMAQAEHDPQSKSVLLTVNKSLIDKIREKVPKNFLKQIEFVHEKTEQEIVQRINAFAPEHLYLAIKNPHRLLGKIQAGAIFIGENTPVALGDYTAGPSHVLPTNRTAAFNSGLSVKDFMRWSSVIENRSQKKGKAFEAAKILADLEGFRYHSLSLSI